MPAEYYKFVYDGGPQWIFGGWPLRNDVSFAVYGWRNEEDTVREAELTIAKKFFDFLDCGLIIKGEWSGKEFTPEQSFMFDLHNEILGLGIILPFQSDEKIKVGPRLRLGSLTTYLTLTQEKDYLVGASYDMNGLKIELAYRCFEQQDIWYFRTSKGFKTNFGKIIPELRLKFTPEEEFVGVGIGLTF